MKKVVLVLAVLAIGIAGGRYVFSPPRETDIDRFRARCEYDVKWHLKSPASAQFEYTLGDNNGVVDILDSNSPRVMLVGIVHSHNGFGALIPTVFACEGNKMEQTPIILYFNDEVSRAIVEFALDN